MSQFCDVLDFLAIHENSDETLMNKRETLAVYETDALADSYPGIPSDYLEYLRDVGWGSFRECQYMVYSVPQPMAAFFDKRWTDKFGTNILCFGDNFSGDSGCFLLDDDWAIGCIWHDALHIQRHDGSFASFIREKMLIGPDGRDERE